MAEVENESPSLLVSFPYAVIWRFAAFRYADDGLPSLVPYAAVDEYFDGDPLARLTWTGGLERQRRAEGISVAEAAEA